jgi:serine/threonine protein kinase
MRDLCGRTIAGYALEQVVGRGGAAVVYRAFQTQLERWVAIKVLDVEVAGGQSFLNRFRSEARAVAALHHPNILNIHDYGEDQNLAYIVMEYVEGGSLTDRLTSSPMDWSEALDLIVPLGDALAYAHTKGLVHEDVKPSNILMASPTWPLLVDFGLAGAVGLDRRSERSNLKPNAVKYLAPEQVAAEEVDQRTDIYGLGLVLYELLTAQLPFPGSTLAETMILRLHEPPVSARSLVPILPEALETVLMRALARDPEARGEMAAFVGDLRRLKETLSSDAAAASDGDGVITTRLGVQQSITGPRLFIATSGVALPIPSGDEVSIGRADPSRPQGPDLNLDPYGAGSAGVSRQHARLVRRSEAWYIEDLRSTNGTYLNEVRLLPHRPVRIRSGDLVRFAQMTLVFEEA